MIHEEALYQVYVGYTFTFTVYFVSCAHAWRLFVNRLPTVSVDDDEGITSLQQQLREKDLRLTDVQLEALSSAHRLQQMHDAMKRLKVDDDVAPHC